MRYTKGYKALAGGRKSGTASPAGTPKTLAETRLSAALAGTTASAARAREALGLARERGLRLDAEALAWSDVRDLQALVGELQRITVPRAHVPRAARHLRRNLEGSHQAYV